MNRINYEGGAANPRTVAINAAADTAGQVVGGAAGAGFVGFVIAAIGAAIGIIWFLVSALFTGIGNLMSWASESRDDRRDRDRRRNRHEEEEDRY